MGVLTVRTVTRHPTDANKIRVTFSEAVNVATLIVGNFALTPSLTVAQVVVVSGSSNTQADLLVGSALVSDASTIALWQFDELAGSTTTDTGPGGYTLTDSGGSTIVPNGIYNACRLYDGTNDVMLGATTLTPRTDLLGDWTVEAAIRWDSGMGTLGDIVTYTGLSTTANAENTLMSMSLSNAGRLSASWESGVGVAQTFAMPTGLPVLSSGIVYAVAAVKKSVGGALGYQISLYVNGTEIAQSSTTLTNGDGGNSGDMRYAIGRLPATSANQFKGLIDVVRVSNVARTATVIQTGAEALLTPMTSATYSLKVTNVTDSATSTAITSPHGLFIFPLYGSSDGHLETAFDWQLASVGGGAVYITAPSIDVLRYLTFGATALSVATIRIRFSGNILNVNITAARYQITGPSVLTVASAFFSGSGDTVDLTVSGTFQSGTYVLTIDANTMNDSFGNSNTGTTSFTPPILPRAGSNFNPKVN